MKIKHISLAILLVVSCSGEPASICVSAEPDKRIPAQDGIVSLEYKKNGEWKEYRDFFNYVYFEGDTVGFFFKYKGQADKNKITATFTDKQSGISMPAERLEISKGYIWGFCLAGSMLEHFNEMRLFEKLPSSGKIKHEFIVSLQIYDGTKLVREQKEGILEVTY